MEIHDLNSARRDSAQRALKNEQRIAELTKSLEEVKTENKRLKNQLKKERDKLAQNDLAKKAQLEDLVSLTVGTQTEPKVWVDGFTQTFLRHTNKEVQTEPKRKHRETNVGTDF